MVFQDTSLMVWYVDGHTVTLIPFIIIVIMGTSKLVLLFEYVWPMANGVGKFQFVKVGITVEHFCNEAMNLWFWKLIFIDMDYTEHFRFVSKILCGDGGRVSYTCLSENLTHPFKPFSCFLYTVYYKIMVSLLSFVVAHEWEHKYQLYSAILYSFSHIGQYATILKQQHYS